MMGARTMTIRADDLTLLNLREDSLPRVASPRLADRKILPLFMVEVHDVIRINHPTVRARLRFRFVD